jgi:ATP-dependent DNA helicase PIF1
MMIKNIDDTLVNGTIGKVTAFMTEDEWNSQRRDPPPAEEPETKATKSTSNARWPVVKFKIPGTENRFREELVKSESFKVEGVNGTVEASRQQVDIAFFPDSNKSLTLSASSLRFLLCSLGHYLSINRRGRPFRR